MGVIILTGASAGLGQSFFKALTGDNGTDEIWLIARRRERLEALAQTCKHRKVRVFPLDLTDADGMQAFADTLDAEKPQVTALINNAGFGKMGYVRDLSPAVQGDMVDLNCRALTALTATVLPYMLKGSFILNVCSIAAYVPTPRMTVYGATKSFVLSFSKGLRAELKPHGINVLALCPGPMRTEFLAVADIGVGASKTFDTLPYANPDKVAAVALKRAKCGKGRYTPLLLFKVYRVLSKLAPHSLLMHFSKV